MQSTEWRPIAGYEGRYEVSNDGRVRSLDRLTKTSDGRTLPCHGRVLSPRHRGAKKYQVVALYSNGVSAGCDIHRLVAITFLGPALPGQEVCHGDGDVDNNNVSNLRWGTHAENMHDKIAHGTNYEALKTHCIHGHEFTPENTRIAKGNGQRVCRACQRVAGARKRAKRSHA